MNYGGAVRADVGVKPFLTTGRSTAVRFITRNSRSTTEGRGFRESQRGCSGHDINRKDRWLGRSIAAKAHNATSINDALVVGSRVVDAAAVADVARSSRL